MQKQLRPTSRYPLPMALLLAALVDIALRQSVIPDMDNLRSKSATDDGPRYGCQFVVIFSRRDGRNLNFVFWLGYSEWSCRNPRSRGLSKANVVTAAVLQGTRVSSSDAARAGAEAGRKREREREREREQEQERQRTFRQRWTASDGRVGQGDRQRKTDVSNRETDSVRRTCQTGRRTASDGRVKQGNGQRQTDVSNRETDSVGRTCRTGTGGARRASTKRRNQRKRRKRKQG